MLGASRGTACQNVSAPPERASADWAEREIDLLELACRLIQKAKYIAAASLLGAVLAAVITFGFLTPRYMATSKLYVMNADKAALSLSDLQMSTYLISDYQEVFKNWHVHEMVLQKLNLPYTYEELADMLQVTNPSNTRILYITVTSTEPLEAKLLADAYAEAAQAFIASNMTSGMLNVFQTALLPERPSSPGYAFNVALGLLGGFALACAIIAVQFLLDDRLICARETENEPGLPAVGTAPCPSVPPAAERAEQRTEGDPPER